MLNSFLEYLSTQNKLVLLWPPGAFISGVFLFLALRSHYRSLHDKTTLLARWYRRLLPLAAPGIAMLLLVVGMAVLQKKGVAVDPPYVACIRAIWASWLIVACIYVLTHSRAKTIAAGIIAAIFAFLSLSDLLPGIIRFLSDISFNLGKIEISAYQVCKFIVSIVLLVWLTSAMNRGMGLTLQHMRNLRPSTRQLLNSVFRVFMYMIAGLVALSTLGIDLTAFAVFGGALGVGLGFGLQKIASNFISGLILLFERSIEVDDMIEMHNGDTFGTVRQTGPRYTLIETFDNRKIMVPNEDFISQRVTNWTLSNTRGLIKLPISVSYEADLELAKELLLETAREHPRALTEPPPACLLMGFTDLGVNMQLNIWVGDIREKRMTTQSEVLMAIWKKFAAHNIGLPHQVRESHYRSLKKPKE
ncbi:MAG: mechanosensitive ion channel [Micavibrio sp.]|nr:mechanosensitive ion channel [Micavibrio sp.]